MHVLLELADGLGAECVRDSLALSSVFGAVTGVEETSLDRDEGIVVLTAIGSAKRHDVTGLASKWIYLFRNPLP